MRISKKRRLSPQQTLTVTCFAGKQRKMFQVLIMGTALRNQQAQYVEPGRTCYTTGGICPKRIQVIKNCVTEGFCGGKRGPLTGIERLFDVELALQMIMVVVMMMMMMGVIITMTVHKKRLMKKKDEENVEHMCLINMFAG